MFFDVVAAMLAGTVLAAVISQPEGQDGPVQLVWDAPTQCPHREVVLRRIQDILGPTENHAPEPVSVIGSVEPGPGGGWRLELRVDAPGGATERTVLADHCETLVDATALVAAIAVDPVRAMAHLQTVRTKEAAAATLVPLPPVSRERVQPAVEPSPSQPVPERQVASRPEPATRRSEGPVVQATSETRLTRPRNSVRGGLRVGPGIDYGALPGVAGGVGVVAAVLGRKWRADLVGSYWFPREAAVPTEPRAGGEVSLWAVGARGCWVPGIGAVGFPLCGGMEAGALRGRGTRETVGNDVEWEPWIAAAAGPKLAWEPSRWLALVLDVEAMVPLRRSGFTVGDDVLYTVAPVGVRGALGVELRFP